MHFMKLKALKNKSFWPILSGNVAYGPRAPVPPVQLLHHVRNLARW